MWKKSEQVKIDNGEDRGNGMEEGEQKGNKASVGENKEDGLLEVSKLWNSKNLNVGSGDANGNLDVDEVDYEAKGLRRKSKRSTWKRNSIWVLMTPKEEECFKLLLGLYKIIIIFFLVIIVMSRHE